MTCRLAWMNVVTTLCALMLAVPAAAETVVLAVPGPGTLSYLPVYLAKAIAADQAEGIELKLRYVPGGPVALRDLNERNCDFVAVGLAAIAASRAEGDPVVAIGQLTQSAMYVFLLRTELKHQVRNMSQLKGKRIGVATGSSTTRSMGHMMMEYLLHRAGLKSSEVQFIAIGQNRETQQAALKSGTVDALIGDEPFASELVARGLAVKLVDLYLPKKSSEMFGGPVVHAALATREDVLLEHPETAKKVQRVYERTLQWMTEHTSQEVLDKLANQPGFAQARGKPLAIILQRNLGMYTSHIKWDNEAVITTERFFHSTANSPAEISLPFADFVRNHTIY